MMSDSSSNSEIVADLAEEFVELHRQGEHPTIEEYVAQHPHLKQEILDLFPAMLMVENLAPERDVSVVGGCKTLVIKPAADLTDFLFDFKFINHDYHLVTVVYP